MKNLIFVAAMLSCLGVSARATPYFSVLDGAHKPTVYAGACADPVNVGHSEQCTLVSLIWHNHKNGYLLIPNEDWSLLSVGYAGSGEGWKLALGPSVNLLPILSWLGEAAGVGALTLVDNPKLNGSFGPMMEYDPIANKGYFRLYAGAAYSF